MKNFNIYIFILLLCLIYNCKDKLDTSDKTAEKQPVIKNEKKLQPEKDKENQIQNSAKNLAKGESLKDDSMRQKIWLFLLKKENHSPSSINKKISEKDKNSLSTDIPRTRFFNLDISNEEKQHFKEIIINVLEKNNLNYTQGIHDLASVFYIIFDKNQKKTEEALSYLLCTTYFQKYLNEDLSKFVSPHIELLLKILQKTDKEIFDKLYKLEKIILGSILLSWLSTWFTQENINFNKVKQIFDFFLSTHFLIPIYFIVELIEENKNDLLTQIDMQEGDFLAGFMAFKKGLKWENQDINKIIKNSVTLFQEYPPKNFSWN